MGGYSPPCVMDRQIIALLEHNKYPGLCSNIARFFVSGSPIVKLRAQAQKSHFLDDGDDENPPRHHVAPLPPPSPLEITINYRRQSDTKGNGESGEGSM